MNAFTLLAFTFAVICGVAAITCPSCTDETDLDSCSGTQDCQGHDVCEFRLETGDKHKYSYHCSHSQIYRPICAFVCLCVTAQTTRHKTVVSIPTVTVFFVVTTSTLARLREKIYPRMLKNNRKKKFECFMPGTRILSINETNDLNLLKYK
ncbi:hypothetical protein Btru_046072 [Bulinus truncatus]|nr:hypothetical protein Btru_046072 [Bulinus truncatus]